MYLNESKDILFHRSRLILGQIGAAAWWHGWNQESYDELAGALIAGRKLSTLLDNGKFGPIDHHLRPL